MICSNFEQRRFEFVVHSTEREKEDMYISAEKYMICCTSFESVFNYVFPNAKAENSDKASEVKNEFLQYIARKEKNTKEKIVRNVKNFRSMQI